MKRTSNLAALFFAVATLAIMSSCSGNKDKAGQSNKASTDARQEVSEKPEKTHQEEKPVYSWQCRYCSTQTMSIDEPGGKCLVETEPGFTPMHKWQKLGQVNYAGAYEGDKHVYTWQCRICGTQTTSTDEPGGKCLVETEPGFTPMHKWQKLGRVN